MKYSLRSVLMAGLVLLAVEARASYSISIQTSAAQTTLLGASGQSYSDVAFSDSSEPGSFWTFRNYQLLGGDSIDDADASLFSSLTIDPSSTLQLGSGYTYQSGNTYRLSLDWPVASDVTPDQDGNDIYSDRFVKQPDDVNANAGATGVLHVQCTPEPSAVALFLAGGIAVCLRRRF
jgi:hypothetical protein